MSVFLIVIIACNIIISIKGFNELHFFRKNDFHIGSIKAGEQSRMFSSGFLHADWMHLFFNMFTLYMFAPLVIEQFGNTYFLLIYFGSLVAGNLLTLFLHINENSYRAIGASGAVTGILYAAILIDPDMPLQIYFIPINIPAYIVGIGYMLYSIYGIKAKRDNIGHTAHFGGAIAGFVITLSKEPDMITEKAFVVILIAIPIVLLFVLAKMGRL